ncbi:anhydro-N-acetylmuramic acid kinase [Bryobacterales bacterium F-183]|nr:anhydro-N-acetylmuramic acid kinase [Bryobacterales bacterium F-183]
MRVAGVMSGTSLDGVDVAIVDIIGEARFRTVATDGGPYPKAVRQALLGVSNTVTHVAAVSRLNFQLGEIYAQRVLRCCKKAGIDPKSVQLIGCHGQTIYHEGMKPVNTLQIGEAAVIAERTGIDVVSNFRERDIAAGGLGAPLVPLFDVLLFRHARIGRVALNLGGIGNITAIPAGADVDGVLAFDTGPANMVMDQLVTRYTRGLETYDRGGKIAAKGRVDVRLLDELLRDPYFKKAPPKTAGREQYGGEFLERMMLSGLEIEDLVATATAFTAETVAMAIRLAGKRLGAEFAELIVGGGGAKNACLMRMLGERTGLRVMDTAKFGVDSDFKEAIAFALLAYRMVRGRPGNVRRATGAAHPAVLGKLTRAGRF